MNAKRMNRLSKEENKMIKIKIHRKKQLASALVPFYLIFNEDIDQFKKAIIGGYVADIIDKIHLYPIKVNQTIVLNFKRSSARVMAINNNFGNSVIYPFAITDELLLEKDQDLLLYQSKAFASVKIELVINDDISTTHQDKFIEYNS